jgi:hypothetical protein
MSFKPFKYCENSPETPPVSTAAPAVTSPDPPVKKESESSYESDSGSATQAYEETPLSKLPKDSNPSLPSFIPDTVLYENIRKTAMYKFIRGVCGGLSIPQVNEMLADEYKGCISKSLGPVDDELKEEFLTRLNICDPDILNCSVFSATEKSLSILKSSVRKPPSFPEIIRNEDLRPLFTTIVVRSINVNDIIKGDEYQTSNKIEKAMHGCAGAVEQFKFTLRRYPF